MQTLVVSTKLQFHLFIPQSLLGFFQSLVASYSPVNAREEVQTILHPFWDICFYLINILNDGLYCFLVKA